MTTTIEVPTVDEVDEIAALWIDLAREQQGYGSYLLTESNLEFIRETFARQIVAEELLVARDDGDIVGFVNFSHEYRLYAVTVERGIVHNLYVSPDFRGAGIGTSLLAAAEDRLLDRGVGAITLEALSQNDRARRFYRRNGYRVHRVQFEKRTQMDDERVSRNG